VVEEVVEKVWTLEVSGAERKAERSGRGGGGGGLPPSTTQVI